MRLAISLMLLALMLGCQSMPPPVQARNDPYVPDQINLTEKALRVRTAFTEPQFSRDPRTGILYVEVPVRATTDQQLYIEYRVTWLDENNNTLSQTGWLRETLPPNVWTRLRANSTTPSAADFIMDVRFGRIN